MQTYGQARMRGFRNFNEECLHAEVNEEYVHCVAGMDQELMLLTSNVVHPLFKCIATILATSLIHVSRLLVVEVVAEIVDPTSCRHGSVEVVLLSRALTIALGPRKFLWREPSPFGV